ncbi:MAG: hypothetical protein R3C44_09485 [Chloroflexota bacterium]
MKDLGRHLRAFLLPAVLMFVLPAIITWVEYQYYDRPILAQSWLLRIAGLLVCAVGLVLLIVTVRLIILIGNGTIMPLGPIA